MMAYLSNISNQRTSMFCHDSHCTTCVRLLLYFATIRNWNSAETVTDLFENYKIHIQYAKLQTLTHLILDWIYITTYVLLMQLIFHIFSSWFQDTILSWVRRIVPENCDISIVVKGKYFFSIHVYIKCYL